MTNKYKRKEETFDFNCICMSIVLYLKLIRYWKKLVKTGKELLSRNWKINRRKSEDFGLEGYFNLIMVESF